MEEKEMSEVNFSVYAKYIYYSLKLLVIYSWYSYGIAIFILLLILFEHVQYKKNELEIKKKTNKIKKKNCFSFSLIYF